MITWQLQEAKSRFSEVIRKAEKNETQCITKNGKTVAYIVSAEEYEKTNRKSIAEILRARPHKELEINTAPRTDYGREINL